MAIVLKYVCFLLLLFGCNFACAQLTVSAAMSPTQLVQNILLGGGVTATNVTYTGAPAAIGSFNGAASNLGLSSGIIITSGDINNAPGPNNQTGASTSNSSNTDPDLDIIMSPTTSYDAAILEFDFIPTSDTIKFRYIFASEEYMEYLSPGSNINDGFGFFISGPGLSGPFSNNAVNIALIPGTNLPVTMQNLNLNNNSQYYFDNGNNGVNSTPGGATIQYDGFTVGLIATCAVQCGQTYHIKIAIGDGFDSSLDSGVFLEGGSFASAQGAQVAADYNIGTADNLLYEGCGLVNVWFKKGGLGVNNDTLYFSLNGTANNGADFNIPNNYVVFPSGQDSVLFSFSPIFDNIPEGLESINITVINPASTNCIPPPGDSLTLYISDVESLVVSLQNASVICDDGSVILQPEILGGLPGFSFEWPSLSSTDESVIVSPDSTTVYTVNVKDICGDSSSASTTVFVSSTTADFSSELLTNASQGFTNLSDSNAVNWNWDFGDGQTSNEENPIHVYNEGGTFPVTLIVTDAQGCKDTVTYTVEVFEKYYFWYPNSFTPNSDGKNDVFLPVGEGLEEYHMSIYNRWGECLFETNDFFQPWTGKLNSGEIAPNGTYIVVFTIKPPAAKRVTIRSHTNLLR